MAYQPDWQKHYARLQSKPPGFFNSLSPSELAAYSPWPNRRTPAPDQATRDARRANLDRNVKESKAKGYGPARFDDVDRELKKLSKQINKNLHADEDKHKKKPKLSEVRKAAKEGRTLFAATPSTCFSEVSWTDGIASLTFANKTQGTWDIEMTLDEFLDFTDGSMGQNFNADWYGA
jgi:hypothetical protein